MLYVKISFIDYKNNNNKNLVQWRHQDFSIGGGVNKPQNNMFMLIFLIAFKNILLTWSVKYET